MNQSIPLLIREPDNRRGEAFFNLTGDLAVSGPLISCLMVSRGDRLPAQWAIDCYRAQTYPTRELVIVSAQPDSEVEALMEEIGDPTIRFFPARPQSLGELRNLCAAHAEGEILCQWDDDDLSAPDRLALMAAVLGQSQSRATVLRRVTLWQPRSRRIGPSAPRLWENTLMVLRGAMPAYPAIDISEDTAVAEMIASHNRVTMIDAPDRYCYVGHDRNSCGPAHFDMLFDAALAMDGLPDHDRHLAALAERMPLRPYADWMAQRAVA